MIFLVFVVFIFIETPAAIVARKDEDLVAEIWRRGELLHWAGYGEEKLSTVVIGGKILCHAGSHDKISGHPYPVSGASMAVFCSTSGKKNKSWAKGSTNSYGEFLIDLPSHLHSIPNLEKICLIKVLHLPKSSPCERGFTGKRKRIKLTSIGEDVRTYTTHNINLVPKPSQQYTRKRESKQKHTIPVSGGWRFSHTELFSE